jgi:hypothetical protein
MEKDKKTIAKEWANNECSICRQPLRDCVCENEEELNKRLCQLCGEDIGDITKGATVLPWGETCATCLDLIKEAN